MNVKTLREIESAASFLLSRNATPAAPYLAPHLKRAFALIQLMADSKLHSVQCLANSLECSPQTVDQTLHALRNGGYKIEKIGSCWMQLLRVCVPKDGAEYTLECKGTFQLSHFSPPATAYRFIPCKHKVSLEFGVPGIYCIKNIKNQRLYVGQAKDTRTRWTNHVSVLRTGKNSNIQLRRDWQQSEYTDWVFVFLQFALSNREQLEQEWMKKFLPASLYNNVYDVRAL